MKACRRADAIWIYTPQELHKVPAQMKPLNPPDSFFVEGARGWLELGDVNEAQTELEKVRARKREHPDVLEVLWEICARRGDSFERAARVGSTERWGVGRARCLPGGGGVSAQLWSQRHRGGNLAATFFAAISTPA